MSIKWHHHCDVEGCEEKFKQAGSLKTHKAFKHNISVTWFYCDQVGCNYKCKQKTTLKLHKANLHDIGVTWFYCDQDGCNYKCKQKSNLKRHKSDVHNIDVGRLKRSIQIGNIKIIDTPLRNRKRRKLNTSV